MDDLLAYTQTTEIEHTVETPLDANVVLAKTLSLLDTAISESGACIESEPLPLLCVEEVHLQQLFQNLIANSLKYRGDAPPHIKIFAQAGTSQVDAGHFRQRHWHFPAIPRTHFRPVQASARRQ